MFAAGCSGRALTLPDAPPVDVDLQRVGWVQRLVVVEDEDVTTRSVDPGRVHRCILGERSTETDTSQTIKASIIQITDLSDDSLVSCIFIVMSSD